MCQNFDSLFLRNTLRPVAAMIRTIIQNNVKVITFGQRH